MADTTREHRLEAIIVDVCDGYLREWHDIQTHTGLSEYRCKELKEEINEVFKAYYNRNGYKRSTND